MNLLDPLETILDFTAPAAFTEGKLRTGLWDHTSLTMMAQRRARICFWVLLLGIETLP